MDAWPCSSGTAGGASATPAVPGPPLEGWEALYREHRPRVLRLCRMLLRDESEAEDVAQEVFITALAWFARPARTMRWGPWLTTVAMHACHRRRRGRWWQWWRSAREPFVGDELATAVASPDESVAAREQRRELEEIFAALSRQQQRVFQLRHLEGRSTREVADVLGVTEGSVKRHLFRATAAFRDALRERPLSSECAGLAIEPRPSSCESSAGGKAAPVRVRRTRTGDAECSSAR